MPVAQNGEKMVAASGKHQQCRRFPATFTFVVRSFTVLDGIGKSLDPRFDMTEIAAPYARGLLLEAKPQIARLQKDLLARFSQQVCLAALPQHGLLLRANSHRIACPNPPVRHCVACQWRMQRFSELLKAFD